ncbi:MAG: XRE family transcriptional regulator [Planctomycetota bacterium]|nr:XRE family transcriptional regulator [Planctomycetota bacterium]
MSLGELIRRRREEKKLTQDQVADRVGISKQYLSNIETDRIKNPPSDGVIERLEEKLKFPPGQLRKMAHMARTPMDIRAEHESLTAEVEKLRSVLKQLLAGREKTTGGAKLNAIARRLKSAKSNVSDILSAGRTVPIINKVSAGYPHHFTDLDYPPSVADEYIRCPDVHDSQAFAAHVVGDSMEPKYAAGDLVIFSPNTQVRSGDDCFVRFTADSSTTFKRFYSAKGGKIRLQPLNDKYPTEMYDREEIDGLWPAVMRIERIGKA